MDDNVSILKYNGKTIYLLGTAHVSADSAKEARELIERTVPDSVCVELDDDRLNNMLNPKKWKETDIYDIIKQKKAAFLLVNIILSSYQKRLAEKFGISAGEEMLAAAQTANELNIPVITADRDIKTTFLRIWRKMSFGGKAKLIMNLLTGFTDDETITAEELEELKTQDMLESALNELAGEFPDLKKYLVDERDAYLAEKIRTAPGNVIVAVVGAAHTIGIKKIFSEPDEKIDTAELAIVPPPGKTGKIIGWVIPFLIIGMMVVTLIKDPVSSWSQVKQWILYNGTLAAFATLLCGGHIFSVLTAFVAAPITSLDPLLAAGWFAGYAEAKIRKPTVDDFEHLPEDLSTFKGLFKNRVSRVLIIVIAANIGSTLGTFLGGIGIFNIFRRIL